MSYAKPNPAYNSYRGVLVNVPPDCGDPSKPHAIDPTCLHCRETCYWIEKITHKPVAPIA